MPIPTDPTSTSLCTEGWKKAGIRSPSVDRLARAEDEFLPEILGHIWNSAERAGNTRLKSFQAEAVLILTENRTKVTLPTDFDEEFKLTLWSGDNYPVASATASTITLYGSDPITETEAVGRIIVIASGTGSGQYRRVTAYDETTFVADVSDDWDTTPDASSEYFFVARETELTEMDDEDYRVGAIMTPGRSWGFTKYNGELVFDRPADQTYAIWLRYYMNVHGIDTDSDRYNNILRNWREVIVMGLKWKCLEDLRDTEYRAAKADFEARLPALVTREIPYGGEFTGFSV